MKFIITIFSIFISATTFAQITTSVTLSSKHQRQLSQIKSPEKKARMLKLFLDQDSTRQVKAARKAALREAKRWLKTHTDLPDLQDGVLSDSAAMKKNGLSRSPGTISTEANKHFGDTKEMKEVNKIKGEAEEYTGDVTQLPETVKDLKDTKKLGRKVEEEVVDHTDLSDYQKQQQEIQNALDQPAQYKKEMDQIKDMKQIRAQMLKKAKSTATQFVTQHSQQLAAAQKKLAKLKRKYSCVPNMNDLSTATKRSSLKGQPLKKRIYLTGHFQILSTEPFSLDGTLSLGYKFNKKFLAGVNGIYRQTFGHYEKTLYHQPSENVAGYGAFASYTVKKGFFAYAEAERMNAEIKDPIKDTTHRIWTTGIHAGIGRTMNFSRMLKTQVLFLYNFTHKQNQKIYPGKFIVRFGFALNSQRPKPGRRR